MTFNQRLFDGVLGTAFLAEQVRGESSWRTVAFRSQLEHRSSFPAREVLAAPGLGGDAPGQLASSWRAAV